MVPTKILVEHNQQIFRKITCASVRLVEPHLPATLKKKETPTKEEVGFPLRKSTVLATPRIRQYPKCLRGSMCHKILWIKPHQIVQDKWILKKLMLIRHSLSIMDTHQNQIRWRMPGDLRPPLKNVLWSRYTKAFHNKIQTTQVIDQICRLRRDRFYKMEQDLRFTIKTINTLFRVFLSHIRVITLGAQEGPIRTKITRAHPILIMGKADTLKILVLLMLIWTTNMRGH